MGLALAAAGLVTHPLAARPGYTGEWTDATQLVNLRFRAYDPSLQRFIGRDTFPGTVGLPTTWNRFGYANTNPLTYTDPSGHFGVAARFVSGSRLLSYIFGGAGDLYTALTGTHWSDGQHVSRGVGGSGIGGKRGNDSEEEPFDWEQAARTALDEVLVPCSWALLQLVEEGTLILGAGALLALPEPSSKALGIGAAAAAVYNWEHYSQSVHWCIGLRDEPPTAPTLPFPVP